MSRTHASSRPGDPFAVLADRLHPRDWLRSALCALREVVPICRMGVGVQDSRESVRVLALASIDRATRGREDGTFPLATSATGWVTAHGRPFVGSTIREVRPLAQTYDYFVTEGMQSNCLLPFCCDQDEVRGVVYFVSRATGAFPSIVLPALERLRDAVADQVGSYLRLARPLSTAPEPRAAAGHGDLPTLADVQRQHIVRVLEHTDQVIEGDRGAAKILGLPPSTLRNRMRRLGLALR